MSATQTGMLPPDKTPVQDLELVLPSRIEPAGAGWTWIAEGWRLFTKAPAMWIASIVIVFIVAMALSFIPIVGQLAFQVLSPVFAAGFVVACRSLERNGEFELEHLFAGFKSRFGSLAVVGLLTILGWVAILLVFAAFVGFSLLTAMMTGNSETMLNALSASAISILLGLLVCALLAVPLVAAYWFAPALVVMHGMSPLSAMKLSFVGALRNFLPFLVYGLIMMVFSIIAIIPFGLGFLVWLPLAVSSTYAAYRGIYTTAPGDS